MDERATGLVLRLHPLTESSLIVHWLTPDCGRLVTVAKGARRPKSAFRGQLDLFYLADFSFQRSRRSELHALREVSLRDPHRGLRSDLNRLQQACYAAALIVQTTEPETPLPIFFALLHGLLRHLSEHPPQPTVILAFEIKLLNELGLAPDLATKSLSPGASQVLQRLLASDWSLIPVLRPSQLQIIEAAGFLGRFARDHLERAPTGRDSALMLRG